MCLQISIHAQEDKHLSSVSLTHQHNCESYQPVIHIDSTSWNIAHQELFGTDMTNLITKTQLDSVYSKLYIYDGTPYTKYMGKVREDTNSGKIWYVSMYSNDEKLIMDMGLSVGDTFQISNTWSSVDSVFFQDGRKIIRFNLQTKWDEAVTFIEGVGPNISLIYALDPDYDFFYATCKYNADILVYVNNNINFIGCMPDPTGLPNISKNEDVNMYPNPTRSELQIELPDQSSPNSVFILRDISGQILKQNTLIGYKHTIPLSNINQGIYIATIINKLYIYNQTIVITN